MPASYLGEDATKFRRGDRVSAYVRSDIGITSWERCTVVEPVSGRLPATVAVDETGDIRYARLMRAPDF